jgi:aryl-alcohol dehydrogenase-like predicted oxidoreductase
MIERMPFGRTGHESSRVIFGGAALGDVSQPVADRALDVLLEHGVNHLDVAASYGDAELRIGPWMAEHRDRFFLATKTGERTGDAARAELERSLVRLGVDSVDLVQLHNLVEPDECETALAPGGAAEAMARARDEGLVRAIGITGHGVRIPSTHLRNLERFDFDSVLFPYNHTMLADPGYRADVDALRAVCNDRHIAIQTIKSIAKGRWPGEGRHFSWYEPLTDPAAIGRAVRFVLSEPDLFLCTTSDARLVPLVLDAAQGPLDPPGDDELLADEARFDITPLFDGAELERI